MKKKFLTGKYHCLSKSNIQHWESWTFWMYEAQVTPDPCSVKEMALKNIDSSREIS